MNKSEHTSLTFDFTNNRPITLIEYIIQKICLNAKGLHSRFLVKTVRKNKSPSTWVKENIFGQIEIFLNKNDEFSCFQSKTFKGEF